MRTAWVNHHDLIRAKGITFILHLDGRMAFQHVESFHARMRVRRMGAASGLDFGNVDAKLLRVNTFRDETLIQAFGLHG